MQLKWNNWDIKEILVWDFSLLQALQELLLIYQRSIDWRFKSKIYDGEQP